jgi:hypothetical protein
MELRERGKGKENDRATVRWEGRRYKDVYSCTGNQCESMPCIAILISTSKNPCSFLLLLILSLQQN